MTQNALQPLLPLVGFEKVKLSCLQALLGQDTQFLPSSRSISHKGQALI